MARKLHELLLKQTKYLGLTPAFPPPNSQKWIKFINLISQAYERADKERRILKRSLSITRTTLDSSNEGIIVIDTKKQIIDFNQQFVDMWKIPESVIKTNDYIIVLTYISTLIKNSRSFLNKEKKYELYPNTVRDETIKLKDGRIFKYHSLPQKLKDQIIGHVWSFHDVTGLVSFEKKLEKEATHDPLTGLPNRALLADHIQQAISTESRRGLSFGVLFFDVDRFKSINDSLGHKAGDELLQAIAKRSRSAFRQEDTIARLGGDEFVMVALDLEKDGSITNIATKLISLFKEPFKISKNNVFITISVGISLFPQDGKTADELLSHADVAMYHAKESGRHQFQFYTKKLNQLAYARLKKENELRQAIEKKEFFLCYQPQFNVHTQEVVSVEALIRWQHPKRGIVLPRDFIPLAEETGLILPIGEWALKQACTQNKIWQDLGFAPICVAVNVASSQFKQENFLSMITHILKETGLKPQYLEIEVEENVIISHPEIVKVILELKKKGIQIALDDFGTGNSSLTYLKKIQANRIKIDHSFVQHIGLDQRDEIIIQAIIDIAHGLNYKVVAEGVETQNQLKFLKNNHCENIQGFLLAKPMSTSELELCLKKSSSEQR